MKAKQSLFVPAMLLASWGVLRWQTIESLRPSVQADPEKVVGAAIPLQQVESSPSLLSRAALSWPIGKRHKAHSRPKSMQMVVTQTVRKGRASTIMLQQLPPPQASASSVSNEAHALLSPEQLPPFVSILVPAPPRAMPRNTSVSYWMLWRNRASPADLVGNGQIGASQAGVRLRAPIATFKSALQFSLSARLSQPLAQTESPEGSIGASLLIGKRIPVEILAERRSKLGHPRDSAWSLTAATGLSGFKLTQTTELEGYVQAGVVGARTRRPFVGGNAVVSRPLLISNQNNVRIGLGIWGDAQREAKRLDIGPDLTVKTSLSGTAIRLSGQWRFRLAGEAKPSSGPAIVIGGDF